MSNTFLDPVTGLATDRVQLTGRKAQVTSGNYDQVLSIAAGGSVSIAITPPFGELWRLKDLFILFPAPVGATAGTHGFYVGLNAINSGRNWVIKALSNFGDASQISYNAITSATATNGKLPTTEQGQQAAILNLIATNASPLIINYDNTTTGGNQTGTATISIVREVEYIV